MKHLISTYLIIFAMGINTVVDAQRFNEIGVLGGVSFYNGDLNPSKVFPSKNLHFAGAVFYRYNWNPRWAIRYQLSYAKVSADDKYSNDPFQVNRNLSFYSNVWDFSTSVEFNFLHFTPFKPSSFFQASDVLSPYIFLGLSFFYFNPKTTLDGNIYQLHDLTTESKSYSRFSVALLFGLGMKFRLSDRFVAGIEWGMRRTFTDYLDDVSTIYPEDPSQLSQTARDLSDRSLTPQGRDGTNWGTQRGNAYTKDWYSIVGVTLTYNITRNPNNCHFNQIK